MRRLIIAMLCAAVSLGFRSNDVVGPQAGTGTGNNSGVGNCASGLYVTGLNRDAPPTCLAVDFANLTGTLKQTQIPTTGLTFNNAIFTGTAIFPDGSTWTNTGITMPTTSRINVGSVNITGNPPALTFNNQPIGGVCPAGDFVNSINAAGVPACGTPTGGGGGSLPTPVSIGNGGLGQGVAPIAGQILVATSPTQYTPTTVTGDISFNPITGAFTVNSVSSLPNAAITDAMLASSYSGIGNCPANQFVTGLNRNAAPTCAGITSASLPSGLTINSPNLTGTINLPAGSTINGQPIGGVTISTAAPTTPHLGQLWFDPTTIQLYIWFNDGTGSQWVPTINQPMGGGGGTPGPPGPPGGATVTVSATAPTTPTIGELWFDMNTVQMFIWYNDGTSTQWVPVAHP